MTLVVDASLVAAALVDQGPVGRWAESVLARGHLLAPHLLPVEVANVFRRDLLNGGLSADTVALAQADFASLPIELFPYGSFASRIWGLRANVTPYDAWYVALAESLDAPLATLDLRLSRAPGPRCDFLVPPA